MLSHFKNRFHCDAVSGQRPIRQHIPIIRFVPPRDAEPFWAIRCVQPPFKLSRPRKPQVQTFVVSRHQRVTRRRIAMCLYIRRTCAQNTLNVGDFSNAQVAVLRLTQKKRQIKAFGGQIHFAIRQSEPDLNFWVLGQKPRHQGGDQPPPHAKRCRHIKRSFGVFGDVDHLRLGTFDRLQYFACAAIKGFALFCRRQAARRALKQPHAQVFFQLRNTRRGHSRRYAHIPTRSRHTAQFVDTNKGANVIEIRHCFVFFDAAWYFKVIPE